MSSISYQISEHDYVKAMQLHTGLLNRTVLLGFVIVIVILWFVANQLSPQSMELIMAAGLVGCALGAVVRYAIRLPLIARRDYRKYPLIQQAGEMEVQEDGIRFTSANGSSKLAWSDCLKWRQNGLLILLYVSPRLYYIFPKRLGADGLDIDLLIRYLTEHLGPGSGPRGGKG